MGGIMGRYFILSMTKIEDLESEVNRHLASGAVLVGGPFVNRLNGFSNYFCQAMILGGN